MSTILLALLILIISSVPTYSETNFEPVSSIVLSSEYPGLKWTISLDNPKLMVGDKICIKTELKNEGKDDVKICSTNINDDYKIILYDINNNIVNEFRKHKKIIKQVNIDRMSRSITYFEPHSAIMNDVIELTEYYHFDKPGKYKIVVFRVICASWDNGFLTSNLLEFEISGD